MTQRAEFPYLPGEFTGYMDYFGDTHKNREPVVLEDGTSVLFPSGWTDEGADKWRRGMQLQRPGVTARTYFSQGGGDDF